MLQNKWTRILMVILIALATTGFSQEKVSVAILDLEPEGLSESDENIISERLRHELFKTDKFNIFERSKMDAIIKEQGFQLSDVTSNEDAVNIGKLIGVQQIVVGSVGKLGNLYTINIRLIDVESGRVLNAANEDCECPKETFLTKSVRRAAIKLTGGKNQKEISVQTEEKSQTPEKKKTIKNHFFIAAMIGAGSGAIADADKNSAPQSLYNGTAGGFTVGYHFLRLGRVQINLTGFGVDDKFSRVVDEYTYLDYKVKTIISLQYEYPLRLSRRFGLYGRIGIGTMGYEYGKKLTVGGTIEKVEGTTTMVPLGIGIEYHLGRKFLLKFGFDGYFAGDKDALQHGNLISLGVGYKFN